MVRYKAHKHTESETHETMTQCKEATRCRLDEMHCGIIHPTQVYSAWLNGSRCDLQIRNHISPDLYSVIEIL